MLLCCFAIDDQNQKIFKKGALSSSRANLSNMRRGSFNAGLPPSFIPRSPPGALPHTQLDDETLLELIVLYQAELQRRQSRKGYVAIAFPQILTEAFCRAVLALLDSMHHPSDELLPKIWVHTPLRPATALRRSPSTFLRLLAGGSRWQ